MRKTRYQTLRKLIIDKKIPQKNLNHEPHEKQKIKQEILYELEKSIDKKLQNTPKQIIGIYTSLDIEFITQQGKFTGELSRNDPEVHNWRKEVFERDEYTCQDCGKKGGKLQAHHVKSWSKYPDERLKLFNGITLCVDCHAKKHDNPQLIKNAKYHDHEKSEEE